MEPQSALSLLLLLPPPSIEKLGMVAKHLGQSPEALISSWVCERIDAFVFPTVKGKKCLCPQCEASAVARGLCFRHYRRAHYFTAKGLLTETWLVANRKMLPGRGKRIEDYVPGPSPSTVPDTMPETKWMFGREP